MSDDEQKPMYITDDLLEQVLKNQLELLFNCIPAGTTEGPVVACIDETVELLKQVK